jgi:hypothetical protein
MSNRKAEQFRNRSAKELSLQADDNAMGMQQVQKIVQALSMTVLDLSRRVDTLTNVSKRADLVSRELDFRHIALVKVLRERGLGWLTTDVLDQETLLLKTDRFDKESADEDASAGLETVEGQVAAEGMTAIANIKLFSQGVAQTEDEVPRIRLELGKGELIAEVDQAVLGMAVGETKRFKVSIQNRIDEAELTLLGLRQKKVQPQASSATE